MNTKRLKLAEQTFLDRWPGGFRHPEMMEIAKKHKVDKMTTLARESFSPDSFGLPENVTENMVKLVTRASLVSVFEKPKFRDLVKSLNIAQKEILSGSLYEFLHGDQKKGFESMVDFLKPFKLAKWTLLTICPVYYSPQKEVFVKPTTAKGVVDFFELENLTYKPTPSWDFYSRYRDTINEMKKLVDPALSPNSPAFTGFLMLSLPT